MCTLLIFLYNKVTNSHCKLTYRCRNCAKNGMENSDNFDTTWSDMNLYEVVCIEGK